MFNLNHVHVKWCLSKIQIKMINLQNEMAVKITKKVKYAMTLYHKINFYGNRGHIRTYVDNLISCVN